jgi:hypothetical protein
MKKIFIILCILITICGCYSRKESFYSRKYPTETRKSYHEKKGLMILSNTYMGRNGAINSRHNKQTKRKAYKRFNKLNKLNKYHRFGKYPNR